MSLHDIDSSWNLLANLLVIKFVLAKEKHVQVTDSVRCTQIDRSNQLIVLLETCSKKSGYQNLFVVAERFFLLLPGFVIVEFHWTSIVLSK